MTAPEHLAISTNPWILKLKDAGERALTSFGEQFLAVVLASGVGVLTITGLPWKVALSTSLGALVVSFLASVVQFTWPAGQALPYWTDLAVRVVKTFGASLLGTVGGGAVFDVLHISWLHALNVAAAAAFFALVKNLVSPNAQLSGSLLATPTIAKIYRVQFTGNGFAKAA